jgi:fluoride exporter
MYKTILLIGAGGFLGSILRFSGQEIIGKYSGQILWGTFAVNIVGSLLIGFIYGLWAKEGLMHPGWKFFLATGFCGGFTTFSTFSFEGLSLLQNGQFTLAGSYMLGSLIFGLLAVLVGLWLASKLS